jgi:hypothetical protein
LPQHNLKKLQVRNKDYSKLHLLNIHFWILFSFSLSFIYFLFLNIKIGTNILKNLLNICFYTETLLTLFLHGVWYDFFKEKEFFCELNYKFISSGRDMGAGRRPDPCKEIVFASLSLTIFIFLVQIVKQLKSLACLILFSGSILLISYNIIS